MIPKHPIAGILAPVLTVAAIVVPPAEAGAQTSPPIQHTSVLGRDIAEALRSPFHASGSGGALTPLNSFESPFRNFADQEAPDSVAGLQGHHFLPVLAVTVASDFLMWRGVLCAGTSDQCDGRGAVMPLAGIAASILAPAGTAALAGGSFTGGVWGSAAGLGAGVLAALIVRTWFVFPIPHALMTMWLSSRE